MMVNYRVNKASIFPVWLENVEPATGHVRPIDILGDRIPPVTTPLASVDEIAAQSKPKMAGND
jgi:hypothetical protein